MAGFSKNLWAPWRMEYIRSLEGEQADEGCFLCRYWAQPERDEEHHVVWRGRSAFVCMNRFPYTSGHLMVAAAEHQGDFADLSVEQFTEMTAMIRSGVGLLRKVVRAEGFNVGFNIGHCAGAGLPDHVHAHIVPRWGGDTNFMTVVGDTRVVPDALKALWKKLVAGAKDAGLLT
jgi:ATP adenylyltransferase